MNLPVAGSLLCLAGLAIAVGSAFAQPQLDDESIVKLLKNKPAVGGSEKSAVSDEDLAKSGALREYVKSVEDQSDEMVIISVVRPVFKLTSDELQVLFPKWSFYYVGYGMKRHPEFEGAVCIAIGLFSVVGINEEGERFEFPGYGNYEEYGRFLAARGVHLEREADARRIWSGYCHLYQKGNPRANVEQVESNVWHLEPQRIDDWTYHFEVRTNGDGAVVSGKLVATMVSK